MSNIVSSDSPQNISLEISYDGTNYLGWQKTALGASIEESLQRVLQTILQAPVELQAASRTDRGVHARGQVVNFIHAGNLPPLLRLKDSLNGLLPNDIAVKELIQKPLSFHPTLDCIGKQYNYYLCLSEYQLPIHRLYSWHCPHQLDMEAMVKASSYLVGIHDFKSFCNNRENHNYTDHQREVTAIDIVALPDNRLKIEIFGNKFMYKMVRNIVGTLVYVGRGKLARDSIPAILEQRDRTQAGITAEAHGLFLEKVLY